MCLAAAACEEAGITTVALQLLREVAVAVRPPRALWVPFPHGYPLGEPDDPAGQRAVLEAALRLAEAEGGPPLLADFQRPGRERRPGIERFAGPSAKE